MKTRIRTKELRFVKASELRPHAANWRGHPPAQREAMEALLGEVGFAGAVIAYERDGELIIIDGHLREELIDGDQHIPVLVLDVNDRDADKILATYDPLGAMAEQSDERYRDLLSSLQMGSAMGQRLISGLLAGVGPAIGERAPDDAPELPKKAKARRGQVYACDDHRVMCGDTLEDLPTLLQGEEIGVVFTDPPYGIDYDAVATGRSRRQLGKIVNDDVEDLEGFYSAFMEAILPALKGDGVFYVCGANKTAHRFVAAAAGQDIHLAVPIVWVKQHFALNWDRYHPQHEWIFYGGPGSVPTGKNSRWFGPKNETTVWEIDRDAVTEYRHPTQKPVALAERAFANSSGPGEAVCDPFLGSGSTLVAAERLGRRCYGMEIEPRYVDVAVSRWEAFTGRTARLV